MKLANFKNASSSSPYPKYPHLLSPFILCFRVARSKKLKRPNLAISSFEKDQMKAMCVSLLFIHSIYHFQRLFSNTVSYFLFLFSYLFNPSCMSFTLSFLANSLFLSLSFSFSHFHFLNIIFSFISLSLSLSLDTHTHTHTRHSKLQKKICLIELCC